MALDGVFLGQIMKEMSCLIGGRVDKIHQPSREEIIMSLRTRDGGIKVIFNTLAGTARVHITKAEIENPKVPPMFCMLLRKHLSAGKLVDIRQDGSERILYLDFDSTNEMGDMCRLTIAVEIMGRCSNLILINSDGKIVDSIKRVGQDMSSVRMVLPGMQYTTPPRDERLSLFDCAEGIETEIKKYTKQQLSKAILKSIEGISPVFAREVEFYALRGDTKYVEQLSDDDYDRVRFYLKKQAEELENGENKYTVLSTKDGMLKDFCFAQINQYGNLMVTKQLDSACRVLDYFYTNRDMMTRTKQRAQDLFKLLVNTSDRIQRRQANQKQELLECANRDKLKIYGDLIMSNLYCLEKGMELATVENYYEDGSPEVKIPMDKRRTPSQNAQHYYNEYRKADTAEKMLTRLICEGEKELEYIDSVFDALTRAETENEINELRAELAEQGYLKSSKLSKQKLKAQPPIKYISSDGFEIRVGRNNKQNDKLTCKDSEKTDIWLHVKEITGSHTVISAQGREVPETTIYEAAMLAAFNSKGKNSSQVPVDYTFIKFVKKPSGAKPGMVIFTNNKTLYVTPDEELADRLKVKIVR